MSRSLLVVAVLFAACAGSPPAGERSDPPIVGAPSPVVANSDAPAAQLDWSTDFAAARERAVGAGRPLLLAFVGSDWCPSCRILDRTVFATAEFAAWARDHVVPVQLDFPRSRALPDALRQQNEGLQRMYRVGSYPAILLVEPASTKLMGVVPFTDRGVAVWIASADGVLAAAKAKFGLK